MAGTITGLKSATAATDPAPYPEPNINVTLIGGRLLLAKSGVGIFLITKDADQKSYTDNAVLLL